MTALYAFREALRRFYARFSGVLIICGRFLLAVFTFIMIDRQIGVSPVFTNLFVILILALISSIMNSKVLIMFAAVVILGNTFTIGYDIMALTALLMLLLLLLCVWYVPEDAVETVLMPLSLALGVPAIIPIGCGLKRSPASIAAVVPGVVMHYYITTLGANLTALRTMELSDFLARLRLVTDAFLNSRMLVMDALAATSVIVLVYAIRKLEADHSPFIAVTAGGVMYIIMALLGNYALELNISIATVAVGALISLALAYIFLFFVYRLDYSRSERLTFEDDDYYYYVKAIPKVVYTPEDRKISSTGGGGASAGTNGEGNG